MKPATLLLLAAAIFGCLSVEGQGHPLENPGRELNDLFKITSTDLIGRDSDAFRVLAVGHSFHHETSNHRDSSNGDYLFKSAGNPDVKVFHSGPPKIDDKTRLLVVMAGRQRNAEEYLDSWRAWAAANNYLVIAPLFDQQNWPEPLGYNFGNIASGRERENTANPRARWSFKLVDDMFDDAVRRFGLKRTNYDIFGHSAGGQFVHRFLLYYPENRVRIAIAANPGFYTLPDENEIFPYGLKNSPHRVTKKMLEDWTRRDLIIMRGTADLQRTESLRQSPEADAQGMNRFERAKYMFQRIKKYDPKSTWRLIDVPGIAHDQKGMSLPAQKLLAENR